MRFIWGSCTVPPLGDAVANRVVQVKGDPFPDPIKETEGFMQTDWVMSMCGRWGARPPERDRNLYQTSGKASQCEECFDTNVREVSAHGHP